MRRSVSAPTIVFGANRAFALTNSRHLLMRRMRDAGWRVVVATQADALSGELIKEGFIFERVEFSRGGVAPRRDWEAYRRLGEIFREYHPRLVHHFNAKPAIAGTLVAQRSGGRPPAVVNTITGLGFAFGKQGVTQALAGMGYRFSSRYAEATIFQNSEDRDLFLRKGWVEPGKTHLLIGSGVDTMRFRPASKAPSSQGAPKILMVSRLLRQKGVQEFIEAAELVKRKFPGARFQLAGEYEDGHPDAFPREKLESAAAEGTIEFLGFLDQIETVLPQTDLLLMPSYYREGVPRVVLEAASCGLPVIGADVPGTREVITNDETGFLVPPQDSEALAERIEFLLGDSELCRRLGNAARKWVEEHCDLQEITEKQLDIYRSLVDMVP